MLIETIGSDLASQTYASTSIGPTGLHHHKNSSGQTAFFSNESCVQYKQSRGNISGNLAIAKASHLCNDAYIDLLDHCINSYDFKSSLATQLQCGEKSPQLPKSNTYCI